MLNTFAKKSCFIILCIAIFGIFSCKRNLEPEVTIEAGPIKLDFEKKIEPKQIAKKLADKKKSKIKRIEIGPSGKKESDEISNNEVEQEKILPPNTTVEADLTARLQQKLKDAYGSSDDMPDVKIYISEMGYDEFISYYQNLGYKVHTVAVPAIQVVEPVLQQKPELADKINLADFENVVIHQVMVDEIGISAADKYVDPNTFQIVEKTFVTKINK